MAASTPVPGYSPGEPCPILPTPGQPDLFSPHTHTHTFLVVSLENADQYTHHQTCFFLSLLLLIKQSALIQLLKVNNLEAIFDPLFPSSCTRPTIQEQGRRRPVRTNPGPAPPYSHYCCKLTPPPPQPPTRGLCPQKQHGLCPSATESPQGVLGLCLHPSEGFHAHPT